MHVTYVENELDNLASEMIPPLVACNLLLETCPSPSMKRAAFLFKKALICIFTPIFILLQLNAMHVIKLLPVHNETVPLS